MPEAASPCYVLQGMCPNGGNKGRLNSFIKIVFGSEYY